MWFQGEVGHGPPFLGTKGADEVPCRVNKAPLVERIRAELAGTLRSNKGSLEMGESTQRLLPGLVAVGRGGLASRASSPGARVSIPLEDYHPIPQSIEGENISYAFYARCLSFAGRRWRIDTNRNENVLCFVWECQDGI